ncbi:MAG TPA: alpha/beta hydrolase-fold protein [Polyangia bacterium]|jgi:enterochelin esterase family protein
MDSAHLTRLVERLDRGDDAAHADFVRLLRAQGTPLVEPVADTRSEVLVTFVYRDAQAQKVLVMKGPEDPRDAMLSRVRATDLWARSYRMPAEARFMYSFAPDFPDQPPPPAEMAELERTLRADPYNRKRVWTQQSLCELPLAPSSPFTRIRRELPAGQVHAHEIASARLGNRRNVHVYTPPGFDVTRGPYPLCVLFDGIDYLAAIPTPIILDNLIAQRLLPPTIAIFVDPVDRMRELCLDRAFADVVAHEIVPFVQRRYHASADPRANVVAGFSAGGVTAVWSAHLYPDVFGNVLAQSDARFPSPSGVDVYEVVAHEIADAPPRETRFHLEEGHLRPLATPFRHLLPVLESKGNRVTVQTFIGGHHTSSWRVRLGDALVALLGKARPRDLEPRLPTDDLAIEDRGASLTMQVLRAVMTDADEGALSAFADALDGGRRVDANTLANLGFALLYDVAAPRAAIAVFSACATRFPSPAAQANLDEAQLVLDASGML